MESLQPRGELPAVPDLDPSRGVDLVTDRLDAVTEQLAEAGREAAREQVEDLAESFGTVAREAVGGVTPEGQAVLDAWRRGVRFGT